MRYCAFLRGINVGGIKLKMSEVKALLISQGFLNVQTVLATGNIIFDSDESPEDLEIIFKEMLGIRTFVRTAEQVEEALNLCPIEEKEGQHIYVFISEIGFDQVAQAEFLSGEPVENEKIGIAKDYFYWQIAVGRTLDSPFGKILGKKKYKAQFTSRNLNTIKKIIAKL